jgi:hypothetical protein
MTEHKEAIIGYSGFELLEECYGYNENAYYVADTEASAHRFVQDATLDGQYRIEPVTLFRIMDGFGGSFGEFAMERQAFAWCTGTAYMAHPIQSTVPRAGPSRSTGRLSSRPRWLRMSRWSLGRSG